MKDLSNTQFFHVETGPQIKAKDILEIVYGALKEKRIQPGKSDRRVYYVRRSDLHHKSQWREKSDHEDGAGRACRGDAESVYRASRMGIISYEDYGTGLWV